MTIRCQGLIAACVLIPLASSAASACTQQEAEEKMREVIYRMIDLQARDAAKVKPIEQRFNAALDATLQPSANSQASQDTFCKELDALLPMLR